MSPIIVLVVMALIPAALFAYVWRWSAARVTEPVAEIAIAEPALPPALATPVLSVRRAPQTLADLTNELAFVTGLSNVSDFVGEGSCLVVAVNGRTVFATGGDQPVTPASNQKLIVGAVALESLGADYRFTTALRGMAAGGVITGDLYLVGGGDPLLSTADYPPTERYPPTNVTPLEALVDNLTAAGITRVEGNIVGDESRYDTERFVPTWGEGIPNAEAGPLGALMVNDATKKVSDPSHPRFADPALGAATDLRLLLTAAGISVAGTASAGVAPPELAELTAVQSAPLALIVEEMLSTSDDNTAELLLKELGVFFGKGGTRQGGIEVVNGVLVTWGLDTSKLLMVDGSGLDSGNLVTCKLMLGVLQHQPLTSAVGTGLPIAGQTGTLATEFVGTSVAGRLHAKTGTLSSAKALSGFITTPGGDITFAMILNYPGAGENYDAIWGALATVLGVYPSGPTVDLLQPR